MITSDICMLRAMGLVSTKRMVRAAVILSIVFAVSNAWAEPANMEKAKAHFIAGDALYKAGSYPEALHEFLVSYDFAPIPDLLLNAGQCYRKLGRLDKALEMYEKYLTQTPTSEPWQEKVRRYIDEIHAQQNQEAEHASPPASSATSPVPAAPTPPSPSASLAPTLTATTLASPPSSIGTVPGVRSAGTLTSAPTHSRPLTHRVWFWAAVAGGAIAVGGAIALGIVFGESKTVYPTPGLGSVPVR